MNDSINTFAQKHLNIGNIQRLNAVPEYFIFIFEGKNDKLMTY